MIIIPAIDLKDGQCVRLKQGLMEQSTVFSERPADMAAHWLKQGAKRLHLVDLNGAFAGTPQNRAVIDEILEYVDKKIPVELGGGIRDLKTIESYLKQGLDFVIIGTAAVKNPQLVAEACREFPGQIIVGLDAKDGLVAIDGWAVITEHRVTDLAQQFADDGIESIIYTDISRDGMLSGVNTDATQKLAEALSVPVIASGGITNLEDIRQLCAVAQSGIMGAITGRAIYEGSLDFAAAQALADTLSPLAN